MKYLILIMLITGCRTVELRNKVLVKCEGKVIDTVSQECIEVKK